MQKARKISTALIIATIAVLLLSVCLIAVGAEEQSYTYSYTDIAKRLYTARYLAEPSEGGEGSELTSSRTRRAKYDEATDTYIGWNSNGDGASYIRKTDYDGDGVDEYVFAEGTGAGYISRIWMATAGTGNMKIYIDGALALDMPFIDYFTDSEVGFASYDKLSYVSAGGYNLYVPITFSSSFAVVAEEEWGHFYQFNYTTFAEGVTVEPMPTSDGIPALNSEQRESLAAANTALGSIGTSPDGSADAAFTAYDIAADGVATVYSDTGAGAITGLLVRLTDLAHYPENDETVIRALKLLRLRMYWDGEDIPHVDTPLGDLFGSCYGYNKTQTLTMGMRDDRTLYLYYYMPYSRGARITVENLTGEAQSIEVSTSRETLTESDADGLLRFSALWFVGEDVEREDRYPDNLFLSVSGEGRLVGINLHLYKSTTVKYDESVPGYNWWGEGDEKFFVDGDKLPSWFGTGTEDFFGFAWCSKELFTEAYHSQSYQYGEGTGIGNHVMSRILMNDNVYFKSSFEGCFERYYEDVTNSYTALVYLEDGAEVTSRRSYTENDYLGSFGFESSAFTSGFSEGEELTVTDCDGEWEVFTSSGSTVWSADGGLLWTPTAVGDSITLSLQAVRSGEYTVIASLQSGADSGSFIAEVGGNSLSELDLYAESESLSSLTLLGAASLTAGENALTLTLAGKNDASAGYALRLDFILLIPSESFISLGELDISPYTTVTRENVGIVTAYEGEGLPVLSVSTEGSYSSQAISYASTSGGEHLFWRPTAAGESISLSLPAESAGSYAVWVAYSQAKNFGLIQASVNGVSLGDVYDGYAASVICKDLVLLGTAELSEGWANTLTLTVTGKSAASSGYFAALDCVLIVPVGESVDLGHYEALGKSLTTHADFIEGEELYISDMTGGTADVMSYGTVTETVSVSGRKYYFWRATESGQSLSIVLPAHRSGSYVLVASFLSAKNYATVRAAMGATDVSGDIDLYASEVTAHELTVLGTVSLSAGYANTLTFTTVGKNASSQGYFVGIDFLIAVPASEFTALSDLDLSLYTDTVTRTNTKQLDNRFVEGECAEYEITDDFTATTQSSTNHSGDAQAWFQTTKSGGKVTLTLPSVTAGEYVLAVGFTTAKNYGIYQVSVNGTSVGCYQDLYSATTNRTVLSIIGTADLVKGDNSISFECVGKNAENTSRFYYLGVDFILIIPVDEYEGASADYVSAYDEYTASEVRRRLHDQPSGVCTVCGSSDTSDEISGYITTPYGEVASTDYSDESAYPYLVFLDNGDGSYSFKGAFASLVDTTSGALKYIQSNCSTSPTYVIYLRTNAAMPATYDNICNIKGRIVIDLGRAVLTAPTSRAFFNLTSKAVSGTLGLEIRNGEVALSSMPLLIFGANASYAGKTKSFDILFEDVCISLSEGSTLASLITYADTNHLTAESNTINIALAFKECELDLENAPEGFTVFNACDPKFNTTWTSGGTTYYSNNCVTDITVTGGSIKAPTDASGMTLVSVHATNGSSVVFAEGDEGYLRMSTEAAPSVTVNEGELTFVPIGDGSYQLGEVAVFEFIPQSNITLSSDLIYNIYVPLEGLVNLTLDGVSYTDPAALESILLEDGKTYAVIRTPLMASEASRTLSLSVTVSFGGRTANGSFSFSIPRYAKKLLAASDTSEEEATLIRSVLAYVNAARVYFFGESIDEISEILGEYTPSYTEDEAGEAVTEGLTGAALALDATPAFRFYLSADDDAARYRFFIGESEFTPTEGTDENGRYLQLSLLAYRMCETVVYTVDGSDGGCYHLSNYLDFAREKESAELVSLTECFLAYCQSARAYKTAIDSADGK